MAHGLLIRWARTTLTKAQYHRIAATGRPTVKPVQHHVNHLKEERNRQGGGLPTDRATHLANDTVDFDLGM
jgi:hypothetical protein